MAPTIGWTTCPRHHQQVIDWKSFVRRGPAPVLSSARWLKNADPWDPRQRRRRTFQIDSAGLKPVPERLFPSFQDTGSKCRNNGWGHDENNHFLSDCDCGVSAPFRETVFSVGRNMPYWSSSISIYGAGGGACSRLGIRYSKAAPADKAGHNKNCSANVSPQKKAKGAAIQRLRQ